MDPVKNAIITMLREYGVDHYPNPRESFRHLNRQQREELIKAAVRAGQSDSTLVRAEQLTLDKLHRVAQSLGDRLSMDLINDARRIWRGKNPTPGLREPFGGPERARSAGYQIQGRVVFHDPTQ